MIYVVGTDDLDYYNFEHFPNDENCKFFDELTDDEVIKISSWYFDTWEDFVKSFNADDDNAPYPSGYYLRVIMKK